MEGPLAHDQVGVLASLSGSLAEGGVPIFVVSSFDTDWLLVPAERLADARAVLTQAGHQVEHPGAAVDVGTCAVVVSRFGGLGRCAVDSRRVGEAARRRSRS
ncbi:MAG TPA: ACT domain-containing protein [Acidimicrobiia bacterium]